MVLRWNIDRDFGDPHGYLIQGSGRSSYEGLVFDPDYDPLAEDGYDSDYYAVEEGY